MLRRLKCWNNHFSSNNFCPWPSYTDRKHWANRKLQKSVIPHQFYNPQEFTALKKVFPYFNDIFPFSTLASCPLDRHFSALHTSSTCELEFRTTLATPLTCLERRELQPPAHLHHCILGHSFEEEQLGAQKEISRSWSHVANTQTLRDIYSYCNRESRKYWTTWHL